MNFKLPMILQRIYFPHETLERLAKKQKEKGLGSMSETVRNFCELALFIDDIKDQAKDPDFIRKIKEPTWN